MRWRWPWPKQPPPPPEWTLEPAPFGVYTRVAGVEWSTSTATTATIYLSPGDLIVHDPNRGLHHQRTLSPLAPDTAYSVEVVAMDSRAREIRGRTSFRTRAEAPAPPPPPPPDPDPSPPDDGQPIPHADGVTLDLLSMPHWPPWVVGSLTAIRPEWASWLRRYVRGGQTHLVIANMVSLPAAMRQAGFKGRDNALWYTLSRSYAEWNWTPTPGDPDYHLTYQREELRQFWFRYLDVIDTAFRADARTHGLFTLGDGPDRCGDVLQEYSSRQLRAVWGRITPGEVYR